MSKSIAFSIIGVVLVFLLLVVSLTLLWKYKSIENETISAPTYISSPGNPFAEAESQKAQADYQQALKSKGSDKNFYLLLTFIIGGVLLIFATLSFTAAIAFRKKP